MLACSAVSGMDEPSCTQKQPNRARTSIVVPPRRRGAHVCIRAYGRRVAAAPSPSRASTRSSAARISDCPPPVPPAGGPAGTKSAAPGSRVDAAPSAAAAASSSDAAAARSASAASVTAASSRGTAPRRSGRVRLAPCIGPGCGTVSADQNPVS